MPQLTIQPILRSSLVPSSPIATGATSTAPVFTIQGAADFTNPPVDGQFIQWDEDSSSFVMAAVSVDTSGFLQKTSNLSDLTSASTARTNLGLGTLATLSSVSLTTNVSGTLPIGSGGTGQTTASAAINALLPSQTGNSGKYLTTNGTSASWSTVSGGGSPGGSNTQIQFNNSGSFGGSSNLIWNNTNGYLGVGTTPSHLLHLTSSGYGNPCVSINDGYYQYNIGYGSSANSGVNGSFLSIYRQSNQTYINQSSGDYYFKVAAADIGQITSTGIYTNGTKLCIVPNAGQVVIGQNGDWTSNNNQMQYRSNTKPHVWFVGSTVGTLSVTGSEIFRIQNDTTEVIHTIQTSTHKGHCIKGASSQSANLMEWQDSSAATLSGVSSNGGFIPASMADSAAANNTIYYSTTASKLVYKTSGGTVNNLY